MYQHLLHLIHIFLLFFGRFLLFELNSYFSPTFLQIPTSPTFYLSYLMDTLAYWVIQQHKRFISTNTCSFNLHLAYRSPDHYYNIFLTNELKISSVIPMHSVPVRRGAIFKIGSISNLSII